MDILSFAPSSPNSFDYAEIVNGFSSKLWVERYQKAGEFKLKAPMSSGAREKLPLGSFVSHVNTAEMMRVETHEISSKKGEESIITISGRSFETVLEDRVIGADRLWSSANVYTPLNYVSIWDDNWLQMWFLILDHTHPTLQGGLTRPSDEFPNFYPMVSVDSAASATAIRELKFGDIYTKVLELSKLNDLGMKTGRPGLFTLSHTDLRMVMIIHDGTDRSDTISFSYARGEIESAEYFHTIKERKNAALVTGKWDGILVSGTASYYDKQVMHVDASDIDNQVSEMPTGATRTNIRNAMYQRGLEALSAKDEIELISAEIAREGVKNRYRFDYLMGDIITINGEFGESTKMRVTEYAEIDDEDGSYGYPTLSLLKET